MRESGKRAAAGQTHFWDFVFLKVIEPGDISFLLPKKKKKVLINENHTKRQRKRFDFILHWETTRCAGASLRPSVRPAAVPQKIVFTHTRVQTFPPAQRGWAAGPAGSEPTSSVRPERTAAPSPGSSPSAGLTRISGAGSQATSRSAMRQQGGGEGAKGEPEHRGTPGAQEPRAHGPARRLRKEVSPARRTESPPRGKLQVPCRCPAARSGEQTSCEACAPLQPRAGPEAGRPPPRAASARSRPSAALCVAPPKPALGAR